MAGSTSPIEQATLHHQAGELARAARLYESHLGQYPHDANAMHLLGVLRHQLGQHGRAVELIRQAVELDASQWKYFANLGAAQRTLGQIDEAVEAFERARELCPDKPEPLNNLGAIYLEKGCPGDARRCLEAALAVAPGHVEAHLNLGRLCHNEGNLEQAIDCYSRALEYGPESVAAYTRRAEIQLKLRHTREAMADFQQVIDRQPTAIEAYVGKWQVQMLLRQFDDALHTMQDALELDPDLAVAHGGCAEILLGREQWCRGWQEYEWRFRMNGGPARRDFGAPEWQGEPLAGKRLLIYGEQTLGDEVMFARAMAAVLPRAGDCLIECDAALVGLFRRSFNAATVHERDVRDTSWVNATGTPDFQIAAGSLLGRLIVVEPEAFGPSVVESTSYLTPDTEAVSEWRQRLATFGAGLNVGVAWQPRHGDPNVGGGLEQWAELLQTPGVNWVNLQAGDVNDVLAESMTRWGVEIHDWEDVDPQNDVDGLAAQMKALDLVICTDGVLAQLAAACGVNAWALLGYDPNWRWGYEHQQGQRRRGVRLFRPSVPDEQGGCWADLTREVAAELNEYRSQKVGSCAESSKVTESSEVTESSKVNGIDNTVREKTVREEAVRLKKRHPTINDRRSGLDGASVTAAIKLATRLHEDKSDLELAEHVCRLVLTRVPHRAKALHQLGALLTTMDRPAEGVEFLQQAVELCPFSPLHHYQLAATLTVLERHDDAIESLQQAIRLRPNFAEAYLNLGAMLERAARLDEAEIVCRRAVEMNPQSASALYNLANVLLHQGKVDETQAAYDQVVELDPKFPKGHWNRGLAYLIQGKFAEGWKEYEWREAAEEVVIDKYDAPLWDGQASLRDKFILLHSEQGVGDEMMFGTCYPDVIRQAGRVMITCDPRLKTLFERSFPTAAVLAMRRALGDKLTAPVGLDFHLPAGSLPLYLRQRREDFPGTPYLQADPDQVATWRERFERLGPEIKIGVSWRAGGIASEQRRRTSSLDHWEPMFRLPGVKFVNLQYGKCEDDLKRARDKFGTEIHHWEDANPLKDLEAAAAQIAALDMVVSVGNTTIHMAGALGKQTWVALPHVPGWRYLISGEKMPWYGSVRLMRQAEDRDWDNLFKRMAGELDAHLGLSSGTRAARPLAVGWDPAQQDPAHQAPTQQDPAQQEASSAVSETKPTSETVPVSDAAPAPKSRGPAPHTGNDAQPVEIGAQIQRAVTHHQAGDVVAAERLYRDILSARPDCLDALYLLGTLASQTGRLVEAVGLLQQALGCDAQRPEVHYNLANALRRAQKRDQAVQHFRRAIELSPAFSLAHLNLGATLDELGRPEEALESFDRAAEIDPHLAEAHHNRGSVLVELRRLDEAALAYETAVALKPDYVEAHAHLGGTLRALGQLDQAKASYDAALRLCPEVADTRVNRAMLLLQQGQFDEGWREYEWRWGAADGPRPRSTSLPAWNGESLSGKTLLVWGEQGIGDEIMFASCVGEVVAMAQHCILECSPRLVSLFARSLPSAIVVAPGTSTGGKTGDVDARADLHVASGSLPRLLRGSLDSFPQRERYLVADPLRCQQWRARLAGLGPGLKVGISWRSGSDGPDRGQRTIDLALWRELIATEGARFVNLQYGDVESEIAEFQQATGLRIHHWADEDGADDFDELAARVASLDLVISVANATVHLAGGLGVDTWTLTPMAPSWRWLEGKSTSPWYPRMSVYSQASRGDWPGVLGDVRQRLAQRLAEDRHTDSQATNVRHQPIAAPRLGLGYSQGMMGQSNQPAG